MDISSTITKENFWQMIHDNQNTRYYRTIATLKSEFNFIRILNDQVTLSKGELMYYYSYIHSKLIHPRPTPQRHSALTH